MFLLDFVALDFETANSARTSACSIGITHIENGEITKQQHLFIRPEPFRFDPFKVMIHGITEEDVKDAGSFLEVWQSIYPSLEGKLLVAHNAAFDFSVIRQSLDFQGAEYPTAHYVCTYQLARLLHPEFGYYRLDFLCDQYGIDLDHHNALSDSAAAAHLLLRLLSEFGETEVQKLCDKAGLQQGLLYPGGYQPCGGSWYRASGGIKRARKNSFSTKEINSIAPAIESDGFSGKYFAFTGTLKSMSRKDAATVVVLSGGVAQGQVNRKTNFLVTGIQDAAVLRGKKYSSKHSKALEFLEMGNNIQIIAEDDFLNMIDGDAQELLKRYESVSSINEYNESRENFVFETIRQILLNVFSSLGIPENYLDMQKFQKHNTIQFDTQPFCRILNRGAHISFPNILGPYIESQWDAQVEEDEYITISSEFCSAQDPFFSSAIEAMMLSLVRSIPKEFDCCSQFEQCSDAKECVHRLNPNDPIRHLRCGYRRTLESGKIFFGENRNID